MATYDFPPDLLQLQRDWYAADARCQEITASHPPALDVIAGTATVTDEQHTELKRARAERWDLTERLQRHRWWATVDDVLDAKKELRAAAQR
ncbi:hypothetical protein [Actinomadura rubrisoli]|uniref:Uncharacterized protein n=1 Tax=Actinomadura rubrisoli TaxID=2530368 RepID=A0A4R5CDR3_9ACTN|nr:hypothetical protein [Actinomadura rubrisoli]TDD97665.1 hypothetical protein E1298_01120 [Actinomadura rubrisoli]